MQNQYSSIHKIEILMAFCMTNTRVFIWILEYWELKSLFEIVSVCSILEYSYQYSSLAHGEKLGVLSVRTILEYWVQYLSIALWKGFELFSVKSILEYWNQYLSLALTVSFLNLPKTNFKVCLQLLIIIKTHKELTNHISNIRSYYQQA